MKVSGAGCSLVDNLYSPVDFKSRSYMKWSNNGNASIITGGLVFAEDLENKSGVPYNRIITEITGKGIVPRKNIGGPAIVALINIAQTAGNRVKVAFYGLRGNDENGKYLLKKINSFGINTSSYVRFNGQTPFTDVLSDPSYDDNKGERTFINHIGKEDMKGRDIPDSFFDSDICIFGGTALTPGIHHELEYLLDKAKKSGCLNFVNTVYDFKTQMENPLKRWPLTGDDNYRNIDLLITDNEEAVKISGKSDRKSALEMFARGGVKSSIVTHGGRDVLCYSDGTLFREKGFFTMPVLENILAERKKIGHAFADTTGCGDNFAGGVYSSTVLQLEKLKGRRLPSLKLSAAWGVVTGGFACLYMGGVFEENYKGEKKDKLNLLFDSYKKQTGFKF